MELRSVLLPSMGQQLLPILCLWQGRAIGHYSDKPVQKALHPGLLPAPAAAAAAAAAVSSAAACNNSRLQLLPLLLRLLLLAREEPGQQLCPRHIQLHQLLCQRWCQDGSGALHWEAGSHALEERRRQAGAVCCAACQAGGAPAAQQQVTRPAAAGAAGA